MSSMMTLADRAIASWLSWRSERRYAVHTRRFLQAVPEVATMQREIAVLRRRHRRQADAVHRLKIALHDRLSAEVTRRRVSHAGPIGGMH